MEITLSEGAGRTQLHLQASKMGEGWVVRIFNEYSHIGAVAIGEYDQTSALTSVSVLTRPGHKDDAVARQAAYTISKSTCKPTCVIAGIHVPDITQDEIHRVIKNADLLVDVLLNRLEKSP
jgi:hypothetical protein